jgi:hypothetical protein
VIENILLGILVPTSLVLTYILVTLMIEVYRPVIKYLKDGKVSGYEI